MKYKVKYLQDNQLKHSTLKAQSSQDAKNILLSKGCTPLEIKEIPSLLAFLPIPKSQIIASLYQLSMMISSCIPLSHALALLEMNCPNPRLKTIFSSIANNLENGSSLSEAFSAYTQVFGELSVAMIHSGSKSGKLAETLRLLVDELETQEKHKKAIKKALLYPSVVLFSTLACFVFILKFVLPNFVELFIHGSLPLSTRILFFLSDFLTHHSLALGIGIFGVICGTLIWIKSKRGRGEDLVLLIPYVGKILKYSYLQRYCLSLKMLLDSAIPLLQAHYIAQSSFCSAKFHHALSLAYEALQNGKSLSTSLKESKLFESIDLALLEIAQKSGKVEEILGVISNQYGEKMQERIEGLIAVIEPLLTLLLGGFILLLALGIFVPIWEMGV